MLAIRMQRTGRKGHAMFRVVVQEARLTPTSGKVVALIGNYDPHAKTINLDKDKASFYLEHGAQPSDSIARLFKREGVKLPNWVGLSADKQRAVRHPEKRRSTQPPEAVPETPAPEAAVVEAPEVAEAVAPEEGPETTEAKPAAEEPATMSEEAPKEAEPAAASEPAASEAEPEAEAEAAPAADSPKKDKA